MTSEKAIPKKLSAEKLLKQSIALYQKWKDFDYADDGKWVYEVEMDKLVEKSKLVNQNTLESEVGEKKRLADLEKEIQEGKLFRRIADGSCEECGEDFTTEYHEPFTMNGYKEIQYACRGGLDGRGNGSDGKPLRLQRDESEGQA